MVSRAYTQPPGAPAAPAGDGDPGRRPASDPRVPLSNLSLLGRRMDSLRRFLADSLDRRADIGSDKLQAVSSEISSAVHHIILNGAALLAFSQPDHPPPPPPPPPAAVSVPPPRASGKPFDRDLAAGEASDGPLAQSEGPDLAKSIDGEVDLTGEAIPSEDKADEEEEDGGEYEIVEMDAVELLAEHVHFCDICGKGFKRDANLRMHMRAHGNQFKTLEALSKPDQRPDPPSGGGYRPAPVARKTRFSCPFLGCNRNRGHKRFRPLKSAVCVKNHFRRSHCPKIYCCTRCNRKSFSVLADLKGHLKHCGECRWRCSCGTSFSRKDKLFGHMALFEGHLPAVSVGVGAGEEDDQVEQKGKVPEADLSEEYVERNNRDRGGGLLQGLISGGLDPEFFEELMLDDGLGTVDGTTWIGF